VLVADPFCEALPTPCVQAPKAATAAVPENAIAATAEPFVVAAGMVVSEPLVAKWQYVAIPAFVALVMTFVQPAVV
jgi:hypothetical protein